MLGSLYTALSGMNAYSKGLDIISNNVANLNTPGFKLADPVFREIVNRDSQNTSAGRFGVRSGGAGVSVDSASVSFAQGELRETANPLDAGIDGNGFFVLDQGGELRFTRAGQFEIDNDGLLIDRVSGAKVLIQREGGGFGSFDLDDFRSFAPKPTQEVVVTGTLARSGAGTTAELPSISIFDRSGVNLTLRARLTRDSADSQRFQVQVLGNDGMEVGTGELRFGADGTPMLEASRIKVTLNPGSATAFDVMLNFGDPGSFAGVVAPENGAFSQLQVLRQDGVARGSLSRTEFGEAGEIMLTYSNGETRMGGELVLAQFDAPEQLRSLGGGTFTTADGVRPKLGRALADGRGRVVGGRIETSNVDLTQQFTDLIILQQGYRASSQISSIANELIQTLLAIDGRR
jgi:flagellar hook protein FlgE